MPSPALVCLSHLRWNFVYQRPQHVLTRLAKDYPVLYIEEPIFEQDIVPYYDINRIEGADIQVIVPHLPAGSADGDIIFQQRTMVDHLLRTLRVKDYILWYYAPMAYAFSSQLQPRYVVYDCMDELSAFLFAPPALKQNEAALMQRADLVFTGGKSLYRAKKHLHHNIHCFPSSIDKDHFRKARAVHADPDDQADINGTRIGFFGVIDERLDIALLDLVAAARPDWQYILLGPVVKIDPATLPRRSNIHYLGGKQYAELPRYLGGWDIAMMPFAKNASTQFISPTKTPEYLAGGKPVIAPSITDVVDPYGELGLVAIADTPEQFIAAAEDILRAEDRETWLRRVDAFLEDHSWDLTVERMRGLIEEGLYGKLISSSENIGSYV